MHSTLRSFPIGAIMRRGKRLGSPIAYDKANTLYKKALEAYEAPALDPAINEELSAFVAKRKKEGGAPTDF
jgi:trimethylamine--corrinoid protein Co-methyltransferase